MNDNPPIIQLDCAGHRLVLDQKESYFRVICNGAIYATFNSQTVGVIEALKQAVAHTEAVERTCYGNPKTK